VGSGEGDELVDEKEQTKAGATTRKRGWLLVFLLVVVPSALYTVVPVVPFLPLSTGAKILLASGLVVVAEAVFLGAALFVGKEVVSRYRRFLDPRHWLGEKRR
jgi:hypothetical protein